MDAFVDLRWVERAAGRLCSLAPHLSAYDALQMARALALRPAWQVSEPERLVELTWALERARLAAARHDSAPLAPRDEPVAAPR